jgi:hypothetical protein
MRTTLDIDDALLKALIARHPEMSRTDAIETAIREYLARDAYEGLRALGGTIDIEDVSKEMRELEVEEMRKTWRE